MVDLLRSSLSQLNDGAELPYNGSSDIERRLLSGSVDDEEPGPSELSPAPQLLELGDLLGSRSGGFSSAPSLTVLMSAAEVEVAKSVHVALSISSTMEWAILYRQLRQRLCIGQVRQVDFSDVSLDNVQWSWLCQTMLPAMPNLVSLRLVRMGVTDRKLAELLRHCLAYAVGRKPGPSARRVDLPTVRGILPHLGGKNISSSDDLVSRRNETLPASRSGVRGYGPLRGLRILDLSENHLTHRSATLIGKLLLWSADTLDELRLMGNNLQDYGFQILSIYISRLRLASLRGEPHLFPPNLVRLYAQLVEREKVVGSQPYLQEEMQSPTYCPSFLGDCKTPTDDAGARKDSSGDEYPSIHLGVSLLDVRKCQASPRGISELLAAASAAHRLSTVLFSGNSAPTSLRSEPKQLGKRCGIQDAAGDPNASDDVVTTPPSTENKKVGDSSSTGSLLPSSACRFSNFAELKHPCMLTTVNLGGVPLSTLCTPLCCRNLFLNLLFCCPRLSVLDLSGTFDAAQLPAVAIRQIQFGNEQVLADNDIFQQSFNHEAEKLVDASVFALEKLMFDRQVCVGNIMCELFAHAALNAQRRHCPAPTAFRRLKEIHLEGTGISDAAVKGLTAAVRTVVLTGVLAELTLLNVADNFLTSRGCVCLLHAFVIEWPLSVSSVEVVSLQQSRGIACGNIKAFEEVNRAALNAVKRRKEEQRRKSHVPSLLVHFGAYGAVVQTRSSNEEITLKGPRTDWKGATISHMCERAPKPAAKRVCRSLGTSIGIIVSSSQCDEQHQEQLHTEKFLSETLLYAHQLDSVASMELRTARVDEYADVGEAQQWTPRCLHTESSLLQRLIADGSPPENMWFSTYNGPPQHEDSEVQCRSCASQVTVLPSSLGVEFGHLLGSREVTHDQDSGFLSKESVASLNDKSGGDDNDKREGRGVTESGGVVHVSSQLIPEGGDILPHFHSPTRHAEPPHGTTTTALQAKKKLTIPNRKGRSSSTLQRKLKFRNKRNIIMRYYHRAGDTICRGWTLLQRDDAVGEHARARLEKDLLMCLQPPDGYCDDAVVESVTLLVDTSSSRSPTDDDKTSCDSGYINAEGNTSRLLVVSNESRSTLEQRLRSCVSQVDGGTAFPRFTKVMQVYGVDMVEVARGVLNAAPSHRRTYLGSVTAESFVHTHHGREDQLLEDLNDLLVGAADMPDEEQCAVTPPISSSARRRLKLKTGEAQISGGSVCFSAEEASFSNMEGAVSGERIRKRAKGSKGRDEEGETLHSNHGLSNGQINVKPASTLPKKTVAEGAIPHPIEPVPPSLDMSPRSVSSGLHGVNAEGERSVRSPSSRPGRTKTHLFVLPHREGSILCCGWRLLSRSDKVGEMARRELEADVLSFLQDTLEGKANPNLSNGSEGAGAKLSSRSERSLSAVISVRMVFDSSPPGMQLRVVTSFPHAAVSSGLVDLQQKEGEAAFPRFAGMFSTKATYNTVSSIEKHLQQRDTTGQVRPRVLEKYRTISSLVHCFHDDEDGLLMELMLPGLKSLDAFVEAPSTAAKAQERTRKDSGKTTKGTTSEDIHPSLPHADKEVESTKKSGRSGEGVDMGAREPAESRRVPRIELMNHALAVGPQKAPVATAQSAANNEASPPSTISSLSSSVNRQFDLVSQLPNEANGAPSVAQDSTEDNDESIATSMESVFAEKLRRLQYLSYNAIAHGALLLDRRQRHKNRICKGKWGRVCVTVAVEWDVFLVVYFVKHSAFRVSSRKSLVLVHPIASGVRCSVEVGGNAANDTHTSGNDVVIHVERHYDPETLGLTTSELEQRLQQLILTTVRKKEGAPSMCSNRNSQMNMAAGENSVVSRHSSISAVGSAEHSNGSMFLTLMPTAAQLLNRQVTMRVTLKSAAKARRAVTAIHEAGERAVSMIRDTINEQRRQAAAAAARSLHT
ncbi:hypothetical protein, conserved [Trypanosoma brucei gambiense DAL972]|uniref:Uncharacterized protein n=1 Tax=Trypanosoma brucei gambiense (strain MHOM/CI/86/DAL972) TaxID=679716 RepID=C9ZX98_TRYB9|nr:hypothetical protein, conserved [Trypanosoma brucei gambiense DAL972]CBH14042.1 hypothetical protein, conserved [Trypanosoma brucei gambiense DAL972]|eukprot:XP_011776313.1 hypothetical protein, conserved [Trypanosoma brucei gambiense DAL972]